MRFSPSKLFKYYFPTSFEMIVVGMTFLLLSSPGIGMMFVQEDKIFPEMINSWRDIALIWGCITGLIGAALIFGGVRRSAMPGTLAYRLTHPRFLPLGD